jgi:endonuclease/exonuclease/phosphatase family metal-dependent hydrolase
MVQKVSDAGSGSGNRHGPADVYPWRVRDGEGGGVRRSLRARVLTTLLVALVVAAVALATAYVGTGADRGDLARPGGQEPPSSRPISPGAVEPEPSATPSPTAPASPVHDPRGFRVASLNVLGASHTRPGGKAPDRARGPVRIGWAIRALERAHVDVAGLQELEPVQFRAFLRRDGQAWGAFPGLDDRGDVRQTIVWRRDMWQVVAARTLTSPYFDGHLLEMPVVRLRHRETGRTVVFVNVHNPANTRRFRNQEVWRDEAMLRQVALMTRLRHGRAPVVLTGDMNDTHEYFCAMTTVPGIVSASGGHPARDGRCRVPAISRIDWIFGTRDLQFDGYRREFGPLVRRATDHALVSAVAHLERAARPRRG